MAKGKDRPVAQAKSAGARTPVSQPSEPRGAARSAPPSGARSGGRTAPDASATRPADGPQSGDTAARLSPEEVYKLIQESAYFKAKARGFAPGHEVQDWIEAEAEVRRRLEGRA